MSPERTRSRPNEQADPDTTVSPPPRAAASVAAPVPTADGQLDADALDAAILRSLRQKPNQTVDLLPLATALGVEPFEVQLAVERLGQRGKVVVPFIEPGTAGGATLTAAGLRWLLAREGGSPTDQPAALRPATQRVRAEDEAARLPRSEVYGVSRGS